MNEDFKKGVLNEAGKMLVRGFVAFCGMVFLIAGINTQIAIQWLRGFHFTDAEIVRLRISACAIVVIIFIGCIAIFIWLMKRGKQKQKRPVQQQPIPQPMNFPAPPDLSNIPRKGQRFFTIGPEEIPLGDLTFHVLKAYNNFPSAHAAMSVDMVSQYCQIPPDRALPAVKELHGMKYIRTVITAPGEWNGHFQITPIGRDYVNRHAT